jgi:hypothetical protein
MARGEIRLHKWIDGRGLMRGLTVEKYRGSGHDHRLRPLKISDDGIVIKMPVPESEDMEEAAKESIASTVPAQPKVANAQPQKESPAHQEQPPAPPPQEHPNPPKDSSNQEGTVQ